MKTIVLYAISAVLISLAVSASQAQSDPPKFEVGGQFSVLNFERFTTFADNRRNELGGGGRFTFNFNRHVAAETQVDFFPQEDSVRIGTIDVPLWGNKTLSQSCRLLRAIPTPAVHRTRKHWNVARWHSGGWPAAGKVARTSRPWIT